MSASGPKKPVGGVSMFGGAAPVLPLKKKTDEVVLVSEGTQKSAHAGNDGRSEIQIAGAIRDSVNRINAELAPAKIEALVHDPKTCGLEYNRHEKEIVRLKEELGKIKTAELNSTLTRELENTARRLEETLGRIVPKAVRSKAGGGGSSVDEDNSPKAEQVDPKVSQALKEIAEMADAFCKDIETTRTFRVEPKAGKVDDKRNQTKALHETLQHNRDIINGKDEKSQDLNSKLAAANAIHKAMEAAIVNKNLIRESGKGFLGSGPKSITVKNFDLPGWNSRVNTLKDGHPKLTIKDVTGKYVATRNKGTTYQKELKALVDSLPQATQEARITAKK